MPKADHIPSPVRYRVVFSGRVQGVGFRATARSLATERSLTGWVLNHPDGTVLMEVQGPRATLDELLVAIEQARPIRQRTIDSIDLVPQGEPGFEIRG